MVVEGRPARASGGRSVLVAGGTGYLGRHVVRELVARGHRVVCLARRRAGVGGRLDEGAIRELLSGAEVRFGDVLDRHSLARDAVRGERFDAVVSCLASRGGGVRDAWRIERDANQALLETVGEAGCGHFVLLSALCVQKPRLAFQHAKREFEATLAGSGMPFSIVRPTAFFKSLSGQVAAVRRGRPFVVFGNGELTACKPISERDLAMFVADCLEDPARRNAILPVGGPGPAITPREQGELLFSLAGRSPRFRHVPVRVLDAVIAALSTAARLVPSLEDKAEFARIGRYYATESMLVLDETTGRYDADATPSFGGDTLREFYVRVLREGLAGQELGDHALFS